MTEYAVLDILSDIDDDLLKKAYETDNAEKYSKLANIKKNKKIVIKFSAMVACFCFVILGVSLILLDNSSIGKSNIVTYSQEDSNTNNQHLNSQQDESFTIIDDNSTKVDSSSLADQENSSSQTEMNSSSSSQNIESSLHQLDSKDNTPTSSNNDDGTGIGGDIEYLLSPEDRAEMNETWSIIEKFLLSDEYNILSFEEKKEAIYNFLVDLAENGTASKPYSLINKSSIEVNIKGLPEKFEFRYPYEYSLPVTLPFDYRSTCVSSNDSESSNIESADSQELSSDLKDESHTAD